ncbi:hypothetical protein E0485_14630 [Paenibacillus albiflavus]|uniref:Bacteriophage lambda Replication protein O N-terminal domain-containing protein n=1 Tax=Paenibacillus albiflavus TaxID=2545760 RepID=A0A4R4E936_9BACL|nr:replication protein [Paenibacillus albiflavus]TCZ76079.1 hypothetical protein E0485_14630 [Paenibacillus albiflavus]
MANPQLEDGYTRIANEILDKFMQLRLSGSQKDIVLAVWRYTYGFKRKAHMMSVDFLSEATGLDARQVKRILKTLIDRKIINVVSEASGIRSRILEFNKNHNEWLEVVELTPLEGAEMTPVDDENQIASGGQMTTREGANQPPVVVVKQPPKKDKRNSKDNNTPSRNKKTYSEDDRYYQMAVYFHNKIMEHAALNNVEHLVINAPLQKWADEFRKIVDLDKRNTQELKSIIDWCTTDSFWSTNILSAKKLRTKYAELGIKMKRQQSQSNSRFDNNKSVLQEKMKEALHEQGGNDQNSFGDLFSLPECGDET